MPANDDDNDVPMDNNNVITIIVFLFIAQFVGVSTVVEHKGFIAWSVQKKRGVKKKWFGGKFESGGGAIMCSRLYRSPRTGKGKTRARPARFSSL